MDGVNWQIIALLQDNARISFSEIGRQVGLTPTAVAERVRHLEDARIIRNYRLDVRAEELGYAMTVFIRVAVRPGASGQLAALVTTLPEVLECHRVTGDDSYLMKAVATSVQHLDQLLMKIRPLGQPSTSIVLSTVVQHPIVKPATTDASDTYDGQLTPSWSPSSRNSRSVSAAMGMPSRARVVAVR
jgi:Lrp/AsnC family transcriptional regulator, leucine-responsive regulatory protein